MDLAGGAEIGTGAVLLTSPPSRWPGTGKPRRPAVSRW
jgi:hypothetical protein